MSLAQVPRRQEARKVEWRQSGCKRELRRGAAAGPPRSSAVDPLI